MTVGLTPRNPSTAPPLQILLLVIEFNRTLTLVGPLCSYAHATTFTAGNNNWYNPREVTDHDFSLLNQDLPRLRECIFRHLILIWNELHSPNAVFSFEELLPSPSRAEAEWSLKSCCPASCWLEQNLVCHKSHCDNSNLNFSRFQPATTPLTSVLNVIIKYFYSRPEFLLEVVVESLHGGNKSSWMGKIKKSEGRRGGEVSSFNYHLHL